MIMNNGALAKSEVRVCCPASLLLFGEYSVLRKQPAFAVALPLGLELNLTVTDIPEIIWKECIPEEGWGYKRLRQFAEQRAEYVDVPPKIKDDLKAVEEILRSKRILPANHGLKIEVKFGFPIMCGLGSSGAFTSALSLAIYAMFDKKMTKEELNTLLNNDDLQTIINDKRFRKIFELAREMEAIFHTESSGVHPFVSLVGSKNGCPILYSFSGPHKYQALRFTDMKGFSNYRLEFFWDKCNPTLLYCGPRGKSTKRNVPDTMKSIEDRVDKGVDKWHEECDSLSVDESVSLIRKIVQNPSRSKKHILKNLWTTFGVISLIASCNLMITHDDADVKTMMHTAEDLLSFLQISSPIIDAVSAKAKLIGLGCKIVGSGKGGDVLLLGKKKEILELIEELRKDFPKQYFAIHFCANDVSPKERQVPPAQIMTLTRVKNIEIIKTDLRESSQMIDKVRIAVVSLPTLSEQIDESTGQFKKEELIVRINDIEETLRECIKREADVAVYPELSVPEEAIELITNTVKKNGKLIVIAGSHIHRDRNEDEIWFNRCPIITASKTINQDKIHRSEEDFAHVKEIDELHFVKNSRIGNFCVNICGLTLDIPTLYVSRRGRKDRLDFMFVPAWNKDLRTYEVNAYRQCYDYFTHIVVANNSEIGGSKVWGPCHNEYHPSRTVLSVKKDKIGVHTADIDIAEFSRVWKGTSVKSKKCKTPGSITPCQ